MKVELFAEIFNKYGWPGLVIIILCTCGFIVWKLWKDQKSTINKGLDNFSSNVVETIQNNNAILLSSINGQNEKLIQAISNQNRELITYFITGRSMSHDDGLDVRLEISEQIDMEVRDLLYKSHATRVALLELHNGEVNLARLPFLKYTMHYEWPGKGIETISRKVKGLDASHLRVIINKINNTPDNVVILNSEDIDELEGVAPTLYEDLRLKLNLKHIVFVGIYNHINNRLIGLLVCEYNDTLERDVRSILNKYRSEFSEIGNRLSTHLLYYTKTHASVSSE